MNSQASVRKLPSVPACTLPPMRSSSPPMWMVGSRPALEQGRAPAWRSAVVLPCVPLTAMEGSLPVRQQSPMQLCPLHLRDVPFLAALDALDVVRRDGRRVDDQGPRRARSAASWPIVTGMPAWRSLCVAWLSDRSSPCTTHPAPRRSSARPDMELPPMPMKCTTFPRYSSKLCRCIALPPFPQFAFVPPLYDMPAKITITPHPAGTAKVCKTLNENSVNPLHFEQNGVQIEPNVSEHSDLCGRG